MDEKRKILAAIRPRAVLKALTVEAVEAIPQGQRIGDLVVIRSFPFRIGRESRVRKVDGRMARIERPKLADREPNNDLYLLDKGELLNISREHLQIEESDDGLCVFDRGSACGTRVADSVIGGEDRGGKCALRDGDEITVGVSGSPYRFRFIALDGVSE